MTRTVLSLILLLLFTALAWSGWKSWEQAAAYERVTLEIVQQLEAENQLENSRERLLEILSFGLYDGYTRQLKQLQQQKVLQAAYRDSVRITTGVFFGLTGSILLLAWLIRRRLDDLGYAALGVALVALIVGLTTPILSLEASKQLPVLGQTLFQFQSKGILSSIQSLRAHGDVWLALLLFLFSVVLPALKTLIAFLTLFSQTHSFSLRGLKLSRHLGKWSMADVFVVATLVVFFSSNEPGGMTHAEIQAGLWFFATYVALSLLGSQLIASSSRNAPQT
jgi:hypothetical protein